MDTSLGSFVFVNRVRIEIFLQLVFSTSLSSYFCEYIINLPATETIKKVMINFDVSQSPAVKEIKINGEKNPLGIGIAYTLL